MSFSSPYIRTCKKWLVIPTLCIEVVTIHICLENGLLETIKPLCILCKYLNVTKMLISFTYRVFKHALLPFVSLQPAYQPTDNSLVSRGDNRGKQ